MKAKPKVLIAIVALALLLGSSALAYRLLSASHAPDSSLTPMISEPESTAFTGQDSENEEDRGQEPDLGQKPERPFAPDFTMIDAEENEIHLSDLVGEKPVLLNFWASWCPPCKAELPGFNAAFQERGEEINFVIVDLADGIQETVSGAKAYLEENGYTFPAYFAVSNEASIAYELYSIPMTVAIDREGRIYGYQVGALSESALFSVLDELTAEQWR